MSGIPKSGISKSEIPKSGKISKTIYSLATVLACTLSQLQASGESTFQCPSVEEIKAADREENGNLIIQSLDEKFKARILLAMR